MTGTKTTTLVADENGQATLICPDCGKIDILPIECANYNNGAPMCFGCGGPMQPHAIKGGIRYTLRVGIVAVDEHGDDILPYEDITCEKATADLRGISYLMEFVFEDMNRRMSSLAPAEFSSDLVPELPPVVIPLPV